MPRIPTSFLSVRAGYTRSGIIAAAGMALRGGGLVAIPTETVYGLAANIFDERAVRRIFRVKGRPADNPLIVHVSGWRQAVALLQDIPDGAEELARRFWPGPLTLVLPRNASVLDCVTSGLDTVAVRMPRHPLALACIRAAGVPLAAPSANRSGGPSPTTAEHVWQEMRGRIDAVVDGGASRVGIESTVLDLTAAAPRILRPGAVTAEELSAVLGRPVRHARGTLRRPSAPGMKYAHYAPATPLLLVTSEAPSRHERTRRIAIVRRSRGERIGLLAPAAYSGIPHDAMYSLGRGRPVDYARGLYDGLRSLDAARLDRILCPGLPPDGIGLAVMNRLLKAATRCM